LQLNLCLGDRAANALQINNEGAFIREDTLIKVWGIGGPHRAQKVLKCVLGYFFFVHQEKITTPDFKKIAGCVNG
jgi:hypothetical protein